MKLTSSHKYIKNTSTCWTVLTEYLLNAGGSPQTSERTRKSPHKHNRVEQKTKESEKGTGLGPVPQGGSCETGEVPAPWEVPTLVGCQPGQTRASEPQRRIQQLVCSCSNR